MLREVSRAVLVMDLPSASVSSGEQIFIAAAGFRQASGNVPDLAFRIGVGIFLGNCPRRS
jgi:hypothetical protein